MVHGVRSFVFFPEPRETKKKYAESLGRDPPPPESLGILVCLFCLCFFFDVFGLPRSKSLQILPCLLPGSGDPNDHAYGSAAYVVKSRPIAKNVKNCSPSNCRSVIF